MPPEQRRWQAEVTSEPPAGTGGPRWRALLEDRWQARVREVTELSLAFHAATEAVPAGRGDGTGQREAQALLGRAVAARRKLADIEEALGRLAAGTFGRCEQCGAQVPAGLLVMVPETRYCPDCDAPDFDGPGFDAPDLGAPGFDGPGFDGPGFDAEPARARPLAGRGPR